MSGTPTGATVAAFDFDGTIAPRRLRHPGLRGEPKVRLLQEWLGPNAEAARLVTYGDSRDDQPLIAFARSTHRNVVGGAPTISQMRRSTS